MVKGIFLPEVTKDELISAINQQIGNEFLVLMTTAEAAALLGKNVKTISCYKAQGKLTDYSTANEHRKFSARQVLAIKREQEK